MITRRTKILAINFGGIGDEVLFFPTLETVRRALPDAEITLLLEPRSSSVEQITRLVDKILTFDIKKRPLYSADILQLLGLLKSGGFDIIVSSGGSMQVSVLLFLSGVRTVVGYDSGKLARKLLTVAVPLNKNQYAADMYHDLAVGLCKYLDKEAPPVERQIPVVDVPPGSTTYMSDWLGNTATTSGARKKRILLHPGMSRIALEKGMFKTWEPSSWATLIQMLSNGAPPAGESGESMPFEVILAGGPDDAETVEQILALSKNADGLRNCFGITKSLGDLAALIHLTDAMVCVDSAPMHIGVGLDKPLVALFGPTDENKLLPKRAHFIAMRGEGTTPTIAFGTASARTAPNPTGVHGVKLTPDSVYKSAWKLFH